MFDVSHMGQLLVHGSAATAALQHLLSNDIERLDEDGAAQYTLLCNEQGGIEDDLICYRLRDTEYLLVLNAANAEHDIQLITAGCADHDVTCTDVGDRWAMIAVQGPYALDVVRDRLGIDLTGLPSFRVAQGSWDQHDLLLATTGYTGEHGCEVLVDPSSAGDVWETLQADDRVTCAGLGARDTLRLEAGFHLHGNDIDARRTPVSAGLSWVCGWGTDFVGEPALQAERAAGSSEQFVAIRMLERGIPRAGCAVLSADGETIGTVTSGTMSPTLGMGIGLGYVAAARAQVGSDIFIDVRGSRYAARIDQRPLYRRGELT